MTFPDDQDFPAEGAAVAIAAKLNIQTRFTG